MGLKFLLIHKTNLLAVDGNKNFNNSMWLLWHHLTLAGDKLFGPGDFETDWWEPLMLALLGSVGYHMSMNGEYVIVPGIDPGLSAPVYNAWLYMHFPVSWAYVGNILHDRWKQKWFQTS